MSIGGKGGELFYSDNYKERKIMNIKFSTTLENIQRPDIRIFGMEQRTKIKTEDLEKSIQ